MSDTVRALLGRDAQHAQVLVLTGVFLATLRWALRSFGIGPAPTFRPVLTWWAVAVVLLVPVAFAFWNDGLLVGYGFNFAVVFGLAYSPFERTVQVGSDVVATRDLLSVLFLALGVAVLLGTLGYLLGVGLRWLVGTVANRPRQAGATRTLLVGTSRRYARTVLLAGVAVSVLLAVVAAVGTDPYGFPATPSEDLSSVVAVALVLLVTGGAGAREAGLLTALLAGLLALTGGLIVHLLAIEPPFWAIIEALWYAMLFVVTFGPLGYAAGVGVDVGWRRLGASASTD